MIQIKDPLYGYIKFSEDVRRIIDTPEFQRLRRIQQLFGSDYVYPGAVHTRAEHSLGTAYLARAMVNQIEQDLKRQRDEKLGKEKKKAVEIGALLHDVGHGPFSHAFEDYLSKFGLNHEDFTKRIIRKRLAPKLEEIGIDPDLVAEIAGGIEPENSANYPYLKQIVGSAVDADKLDYIKRDAYHTGAEYGFIDTERIVNCLRIYDDQICVHEKAVQSIEAMLIARALAFKSIYYHSASRAAQLLIDKAIKEGAEELNLSSITDDLTQYLAWDDRTLWCALLDVPSSKKYLEMLQERKLLKVAWQRSGSADLLSSDLITMFTSSQVREKIADGIREEADIPDEPVFLDSPTLPNIPYYHWIKGPSMEIPILSLSTHGEKVVKPISSISRTAQALESFLYVVRVYTLPKYREKVRKAAKKIFSGITERQVEELHM